MHISFRRVPWIAALLSLSFVASFLGFERPASGRNAPQSADESSAALESQLLPLLAAAKDRNPANLNNLIDDLQVPPDSKWFETNFGDDNGPRLAAAYGASWQNYKSGIADAFLRERKQKKTEIAVVAFSLASFPVAGRTVFNAQFIRAVLQDAAGPLSIYTVELDVQNGERATVPGIFVLAAGKFRCVSNQTFYNLPNVKPTRVRFPPQMVDSQVVYRVPPKLSPSQVFEHGEVVVHVVIGIDGTVAQATATSGPPDLAAAAVEAIRQWRYKPTILGGDPVEVDATVTITF
jgi:TonB family protein